MDHGVRPVTLQKVEHVVPLAEVGDRGGEARLGGRKGSHLRRDREVGGDDGVAAGPAACARSRLRASRPRPSPGMVLRIAGPLTAARVGVGRRARDDEEDERVDAGAWILRDHAGWDVGDVVRPDEAALAIDGQDAFAT